MKLYQTIDGTLIGFYRERGGAVQCTIYRDKYEMQLVTKQRDKVVYVPGYFEEVEKTEPGYWEDKLIMTPGHYEPETKTWEEHTETRYREVPGHYEIQQVWFPEETVTKYYWREAHPARGLEAAWIPYDEVVPGYFKDQKVWIDTHTEEYQEIIPAGEKTAYIWIAGYGTMKRVWTDPVTTKTKVWIEPTTERVSEDYQVLEEVMVGREPVYEYVDPSQVQGWEVVELVPGPADRPDIEDSIKIRNTDTGEVLTTTARYIGLAERIDENEYVVP